MKESSNSETAFRSVIALTLGTFFLSLSIGCDGSDAGTNATAAVAGPPTPVGREASSPALLPAGTASSSASPGSGDALAAKPSLRAFPLPAGSRPHDVAPVLDGGVWYTAQGSGELGWLDPDTGETRHTPLGAGSRPHGVILIPS